MNYINFDLTLDECRVVFDSIDGLVIVDQNGIIKYLSPDMLERIETCCGSSLPVQITGKHISEIHPLSKLIDALKTERSDELCIYLVTGIINAARIKMLHKDGKLVGAIDYDLFTYPWQITHFLNKIASLTREGLIDLGVTPEVFGDSFKNLSSDKKNIHAILGHSRAIVNLKDKIYAMSESNSTVLISGETGTGKELVANAIHRMSLRTMAPMIKVNCAAIPESLFESELFGYESGSFTGALKAGKKGKFELADKGTIFLDEIDQIPYHIQPKLLRVLQEKEIDKIGSKSIPIDVRVIAATNKNLKQLVSKGLFREDLYYRLNVINMHVPSLRDRKEDIPLLVQYQIMELNRTMNKNVKGVTRQAIRLLEYYDWPGNIRELNNSIERAMNICTEMIIDEQYFEDIFCDSIKNEDTINFELKNSLDIIRDEAEKNAIIKVLHLYNGNKSKAADFLRISRPTLHYKLNKLGITTDDFSSEGIS